MQQQSMYCRSTSQAFKDAIAAGVLSDDTALRDYAEGGVSAYAGNWMYMYSMDGHDFFKNIAQRHYISSKIPEDAIND